MTTLTVDYGAYTTTRAIAERLGLPVSIVCSWAVAWHGPIGSGYPRSLTLVDLLVARAWLELRTIHHGARYRPVHPRLRAVEAAIRADPRRWLLIAGKVVETHDDAETAALAWADSGQPAGQLIDLWATP